jgi:hypothetical protein
MACSIESAPRDGTPILVWAGSGAWELAMWDQGAWCGAHHSSMHGNELHAPTHWMPQPAAPRVGEIEKQAEGM